MFSHECFLSTAYSPLLNPTFSYPILDPEMRNEAGPSNGQMRGFEVDSRVVVERSDDASVIEISDDTDDVLKSKVYKKHIE